MTFSSLTIERNIDHNETMTYGTIHDEVVYKRHLWKEC